MDSILANRLYSLIRQIPPGRVTTYGALARALGPAVGPRQVGRLISRLPPDHEEPTHRVVSAKGIVLCPRGRGSEAGARARLLAEGIHVDARGRVDLKESGWEPPST